ncbi:MAG: DUF86 domain-containing protein [Candidatus Diapherotrites archaeon]
MKTDGIYLQHILESTSDIERFVEGVSKEEFMESAEKQAAVIRKLEIIGEAVKNTSNCIRNRHPEIPWAEIARTRDKLIHGYFEVNAERVWVIVKRDLPGLKKNMEKILKKEESSEKHNGKA